MSTATQSLRPLLERMRRAWRGLTAQRVNASDRRWRATRGSMQPCRPRCLSLS